MKNKNEKMNEKYLNKTKRKMNKMKKCFCELLKKKKEKKVERKTLSFFDSDC